MSYDDYLVGQKLDLECKSYKVIVYIGLIMARDSRQQRLCLAMLEKLPITEMIWNEILNFQYVLNSEEFMNETVRFEGVAQALLRRGDTDNCNLVRIDDKFVFLELQARYDAGGGVIWKEDLEAYCREVKVEASQSAIHFDDYPTEAEWRALTASNSIHPPF